MWVAAAAAAAVLLVGAAPAHADGQLTVTVGTVTLDQVQLVVAVPGATGPQAPAITVSRDGHQLPSTVQLDQPGSSPAGARTVVVVLDTGAAMARPSLDPAREGVLAFADAVPADVAVGLVAAADRPAVALRPTRDREALRAAVSALPAAAGTDLAEGLRAAADLGPAASERRLLIVASGRNAGGLTSQALPEGQRVDVVPVGAVPGGLDPLRELVTASGGTVQPAANPTAVTSALRSAAATVPLRVTIDVAVPPELAGTAATLTVTAGTGAAKASGEVPVRFASPVSSTAADPGAYLPGVSTPRPGLLAALVFGVLLVSILLVVSGLGGSVRRSRLQQVQQFRPAGRGPRADGQVAAPRPEGGFAQTVLGLSDRVVKSGGAEQRIAHKLERAGMAMRPHEWTAWRSGAVVAGAVLLGLLGGLLGAVLGAALGWLAAGLYRRLRESRRRQAFADQLPDALQLVVGSLRSGFSLAQAIDAVVQDSPPGPLAVELGRAVAEVRLGSDLDDALERAARRIDNDDLAWAVMAVRIQRETGGNLAEILETTVETLRERDRLRRHVHALSAEGRLSAYILTALPFVMAGWMLLVRRDYLSALWTTSVGLVMLVGAAVLMVIGTIWMARWVKVEV